KQVSCVDEGFGHHDAGARNRYARDDHGGMPAIDGAEHHLPSHRARRAPGIPGNALSERHLAGGGVGREGQGGPVRSVYFSTKIEPVRIGRLRTHRSVLEDGIEHYSIQREKIIFERGRSFYYLIPTATVELLRAVLKPLRLFPV